MKAEGKVKTKRKENSSPSKDILAEVPVNFLLQNLNNAITIFDNRHQKFIYTNPQFLRFVGIAKSEVNSLEDEFLDRIYPQDLLILNSEIQQKLSDVCKKYIHGRNNHLTYSITLRLKNYNGKYEHVLIQSTVLEWFSKSKNERAIELKIYTNVSEQKKDNALVLAVNIFDEVIKQWETVLNERFCIHPSMITKKECEVMNLIVEGNTAKKICEKLNMNYYTVRAHWRSILFKTGCKTQHELRNMAIREGWI